MNKKKKKEYLENVKYIRFNNEYDFLNSINTDTFKNELLQSLAEKRNKIENWGEWLNKKITIDIDEKFYNIISKDLYSVNKYLTGYNNTIKPIFETDTLNIYGQFNFGIFKDDEYKKHFQINISFYKKLKD